jgi:hypothetical protein
MGSTENLNSEIFKALFANEVLYKIDEKMEHSVEPITNIQIVSEPKSVIKEAVITIEEPPKVDIINIPLLLIVDTISEAEKVFLEKVLKAVNLDLNSVEVITLGMLNETGFISLSTNKSYKKIISFGVPFVKLNLQIMLMPYENKLIEGVWFMLAEKLVVVENDVAHKRSLWASLQHMFA